MMNKMTIAMKNHSLFHIINKHSLKISIFVIYEVNFSTDEDAQEDDDE